VRTFAEIAEIAQARHPDAPLRERLRAHAPTADPAAISDDRALAAMTKRVFAAGFRWKVIDAKWPGFEQAFHGFDVGWCAAIDAQDLDTLVADARIVRNAQKIATVPANAALIQDIADTHGSFSQWIADWPDTDPVGLWEALSKRGKRLGGDTGAWLLRDLGKDTFRFSRDVVARLVAEGVIDKAPTSKRARAAAQDAIVAWSQASGWSLAEVSLCLAASIDAA